MSASNRQMVAKLNERVIGQPDSLSEIARFYEIYAAGLAPEGRPAGVFMLLGPTGTGKTSTVEALADIVHGSRNNLLRIDCGEYQMDHEVAKLIGAPPGYLGHCETQPVLTQMRLNQVMSDRANIAIVLFDEIEKACASMMRLLLGILDRGVLRLGDNSTVRFERTMIFFTSNLGFGKMARLNSMSGLGMILSAKDEQQTEYGDCMGAAKSHFPPEFMNRIDAFLTYRHLSQEDIHAILDLEMQGLANHISRRLGDRLFFIQMSRKTREWIAENAFSHEYGARNLKRFIQRELLSPLAGMVADGEIPPQAIVKITNIGDGLEFSVVGEG